MRILYRFASNAECYGNFYNWYTTQGTGSDSITSSDDWRVPSRADWYHLWNTYDPTGTNLVNTSGGNIKEEGLVHWQSPNTGATNSSGFTALGAGIRSSSGPFIKFKQEGFYWTIDEYPNGTSGYCMFVEYNTRILNEGYGKPKKDGLSIRLCKTTSDSEGTTGTYLGNDGREYNTIVAAGRYWITENLEEERYRGGANIPYVELDADWVTQSGGARCYVNNNASYNCKTPTYDICYGYLYNVYVTADIRKLTSDDSFSLPTLTQFQELADYLGAAGDYTSNTVGKLLKKEGLVFWDTLTNGNDDLTFGAKGTGTRNSYTGVFSGLKNSSPMRTLTQGILATQRRYGYVNSSSDVLQCNTSSSLLENEGAIIRLVKDATGLSDGTTTTYIGNDGKTYNAVVINELYWTTENLEETEYRNGDSIPNVMDNTTWSTLTTGALCLYDNDLNNACKLPLPNYEYEEINNGYLYNWYALDTSTTGTDIASEGWHVATISEYNTLASYLGGLSVAGGKLKEIGFTYWSSPNTGATNEVLFNARPGGDKQGTNFSGKGTYLKLFSATSLTPNDVSTFELISGSESASVLNSVNAYGGGSVRLVKNSTILNDGESGLYTGNDGKVYRTICIGTQEWLADNLAETKFKNGDLIPEKLDSWFAYLNPARCVYDNDESNK